MTISILLVFMLISVFTWSGNSTNSTGAILMSSYARTP